jgi:cytochrome oxidase Cu insertion factor (SCO1/SenC/PrrC family)
VAAVRGSALLLVLLAAGLEGCGGGSASYVGSQPPSGVKLPSFSLHDQSGRVVRSHDLRDKVVLITFLDSACHEACPPTTVTIGHAVRLLAPEQRKQVAALALSVDPRVDTPPRVRAFLRRNHAERELSFLLGTIWQLRPIWNAFHILPAVDTGDSDVHTIAVEIYDRDGTWVSSLHNGVDLDADNLHHDLVAALQ